MAQEKHYPMGADLTMSGDCPMGAWLPMACMFCPYGHMTECHYPMTCEEAMCSHYERELEAEGEYFPEEGLL